MGLDASVAVNGLLPFTLELHVFDALLLNVVAVIKTSSVGEIHEQAHFHLTETRRRAIRFVV